MQLQQEIETTVAYEPTRNNNFDDDNCTPRPPADYVLPAAELCEPAGSHHEQTEVEVEDGEGGVLGPAPPVQQEGEDRQQGAGQGQGAAHRHQRVQGPVLSLQGGISIFHNITFLSPVTGWVTGI